MKIIGNAKHSNERNGCYLSSYSFLLYFSMAFGRFSWICVDYIEQEEGKKKWNVFNRKKRRNRNKPIKGSQRTMKRERIGKWIESTNVCKKELRFGLSKSDEEKCDGNKKGLLYFFYFFFLVSTDAVVVVVVQTLADVVICMRVN